MAEGQGRFFPEQGNRQPPRGMERRGGTRLNVTGAPPVPGFRPGGVTATPDRPTAPTLPRPDTVQPPPEQAPQKPKKRHTGRNIALAGTVLGVLGAGVGTYEAYQNNPAVHRAVDSAFLDHLRGKSSEASIAPDVFDNNALRGTISNENTLVLSPEEIKRTLPPIIVNPENNSATILFPFQLPEGTKAQLAKTVVVPKDNPNSFSNQAEKVAISEILLPLGTKIVNPIEGAHVSLLMGNAKLGEDPNLVKQANFYWYDETNNHLYRFSVTPKILPGPMFKPIIRGDEYNKTPYDWETLPVANRGLEIMETTQNFQPVVVDVEIYNGKTNSLDALNKNLSEKTLGFGKVDFFAIQRINSGGKTKLVVLENQK